MQGQHCLTRQPTREFESLHILHFMGVQATFDGEWPASLHVKGI